MTAPTVVQPRRVVAVKRAQEFHSAFAGPIDGYTSLYRNATSESLKVLSDASSTLAQRRYALAHVREYHRVLSDLADESAAWLRVNINDAYLHGIEVGDGELDRIRRIGVNIERPRYEVFAAVHHEAIGAIAEEVIRKTDFALAQIGRRADDVFRTVGVQEVARGIAEGKTRVAVTRSIKERLLREGRANFVDKAGRRWSLDRYGEMVARTTTREAMVQGTIQRLKEHGIELVQITAHACDDFCVYYEGVVANIGAEPHPRYPFLSQIGGGPPFHCNCLHTIVPFVSNLEDAAAHKAGESPSDVWDKSPADMQRRYRREHRRPPRPPRKRKLKRPAPPKPLPPPKPPPKPRPSPLLKPKSRPKKPPSWERPPAGPGIPVIPPFPSGGFKTPASAEKWMRQAYPNTTADLTGIAPEYLTRTVKQWHKLAQGFPEVAEQVTYLGTYRKAKKLGVQHPNGRWSRSTWGHSWAADDTDRMSRTGGQWLDPRTPEGKLRNQIGLSPKWFGDPAAFETSLKRAAANGFHPAGCDTMESVISHEFGHQIEAYYHLKSGWLPEGVSVLPATGSNDYVGLVRQTFRDWWASHSATESLSGYAARRPQIEGFAEAYAQRSHAPRATWDIHTKRLDTLLKELHPSKFRSGSTSVRFLDTVEERMAAQRQVEKLGRKLELYSYKTKPTGP